MLHKPVIMFARILNFQMQDNCRSYDFFKVFENRSRLYEVLQTAMQEPKTLCNHQIIYKKLKIKNYVYSIKWDRS